MTAKLIDLEKAKRLFFRKHYFYKDLDRFVRHTKYIPKQDLMYFINQYSNHGKPVSNPSTIYSL